MATSNSKKRQTKGSAKAQSRAARLMASQAVYQWLVTSHDIQAIVADFLHKNKYQVIDGEELLSPNQEHFSKLVQEVEKNEKNLFSLLSAQKPDGAFNKLDILLQSIMLTGACELLSFPEIEVLIIINDYVDVTKAFYEQKEAAMVNAILDKIARVIRQ